MGAHPRDCRSAQDESVFLIGPGLPAEGLSSEKPIGRARCNLLAEAARAVGTRQADEDPTQWKSRCIET